MAQDFSRTRYKIWPGVDSFLRSLSTDSLILDAGCGNGKNMMATTHQFIGLDTCEEFLQIIRNKITTLNLTNICDLINGSVCELPFENNKFDGIISIAVIHHLQTPSLRLKAFGELIRVCKVGGSILITVWQLETNPTYDEGVIDPKSLDPHDRLIKWSAQGQFLYRFYHFYTLDEIQDLIKLCELTFDIKQTTLSVEKNNYYIKFDK